MIYACPAAAVHIIILVDQNKYVKVLFLDSLDYNGYSYMLNRKENNDIHFKVSSMQ